MRWCLILLLLCTSCTWPGIDRHSKPYPISPKPKDVLVSAQPQAKSKPPPQTGYITLAWDESVSPSVRYYNLYLGPQGGPYTNHVATSDLRITLRLPKGPYQFAATSVDTNGLESGIGNIVKWNVKPSNNL